MANARISKQLPEVTIRLTPKQVFIIWKELIRERKIKTSQKDWLENPKIIKELERRAEQAEKDYEKGRLESVNTLFKKMGI